ncbi:hypothetical protein C1645_833715 [Glomus cerebriforme]|uniref:Uncharacterized protein n=1 Tax=Glomus cerebriforme TaxID=658196 RepID=A0A397SF62_9GLOM|nr:hypothetical protein C1645_833715 [Glomus cerebriforme]
MSNIIKRYLNINIPRNHQISGHEEEVVSEVDKLITENGQLQNELYRERLIVVKLKWKIDNLEEQSKKRLKSKERSPDEANNIAARSEIKHILKGQISNEYVLDYDKTFIEQSDKIYKKLISELKKLMSEHYNPSVTQLSN